MFHVFVFRLKIKKLTHKNTGGILTSILDDISVNSNVENNSTKSMEPIVNFRAIIKEDGSNT